MKTALPAECSASAVCVCVSVSELSVSLTHSGRNGFFLLTAYQVSPGSSVVAAAIHTGWIALMKTVSSWSLPVVLVLRQPVNTGKLQRKPPLLLLMWSARLPLFTLADPPPKTQSWVTSWVLGLFCQRVVSHLRSHLWSFPHGRVPLNTKVSEPSEGKLMLCIPSFLLHCLFIKPPKCADRKRTLEGLCTGVQNIMVRFIKKKNPADGHALA